MSEPISIITPVKNGRSYILACIANVQSSSHTPIEHIIVDGGSTDGTIESVESQVSDSKRLRLLKLPGSNQSEALNFGIKESAYSKIGILNVDDFYEPNTIARAGQLFSENPGCRFLVGNCRVLGAADELLHINRPHRMRFVDVLIADADCPFPCNPSAYFYDKEIHAQVGYYDEHEEYGMDLDFLLRASRSIAAMHVDEIWGNFRRIEGTKTYSDMQNGLMESRSRSIRWKYLPQLKWSEVPEVFFRGIVARGKYEIAKLRVKTPI